MWIVGAITMGWVYVVGGINGCGYQEVEVGVVRMYRCV